MNKCFCCGGPPAQGSPPYLGPYNAVGGHDAIFSCDKCQLKYIEFCKNHGSGLMFYEWVQSGFDPGPLTSEQEQLLKNIFGDWTKLSEKRTEEIKKSTSQEFIEYHFPNICPECGDNAYVGAAKVKCINGKCRHYTGDGPIYG